MIRLKELRIEYEKTQDEIAKILGISRQVYANYENEINQPSIEMLIKMSNFFQCSVDYLIGFSDDLGNISVFQSQESLTTNEQKIIDIIRRFSPKNINELITMYSKLPNYMQESIFAELKGMHLGYTVSKNKKENNL